MDLGDELGAFSCVSNYPSVFKFKTIQFETARIWRHSRVWFCLGVPSDWHCEIFPWDRQQAVTEPQQMLYLWLDSLSLLLALVGCWFPSNLFLKREMWFRKSVCKPTGYHDCSHRGATVSQEEKKPYKTDTWPSSLWVLAMFIILKKVEGQPGLPWPTLLSLAYKVLPPKSECRNLPV